jgi:hypothetical protein
MRRLLRYIIAVAALTGAAAVVSYAQETFSSTAQFDKTIMDFGEVALADGPLECKFEVKNISSKPIAIYNVVTSCGCTSVKWTREPLQPGKTGTISTVYTNDEGPYPFDKNITVYISGITKPIILKIRGIAYDKKKSLEEIYTFNNNGLGLKETEFKCGNLEQGGHKTEISTVANLNNSPLKVEFTKVSPGLSISLDQSTIPARSTAKMKFTVTADRSRWGKNFYYATPVVNGKEQKPIAIWAFTKENFSNITEAERAKAPRPMFKTSTYSFGKIKQGTQVVAEFTCTNSGKSDFEVYKVDIDAKGATVHPIPVAAPSKQISFKVDLDTSKLPKGETMVLVTLTTNSPSRPLINLFITGWLD